MRSAEKTSQVDKISASSSIHQRYYSKVKLACFFKIFVFRPWSSVKKGKDKSIVASAFMYVCILEKNSAKTGQSSKVCESEYIRLHS